MKITEFLWDKLYFLIFIVGAAVFISMVVGDKDKIIYITLMWIVFSFIYLLIDYIKNYKFFKDLRYIVDEDNEDKLRLLHTYLKANT